MTQQSIPSPPDPLCSTTAAQRNAEITQQLRTLADRLGPPATSVPSVTDEGIDQIARDLQPTRRLVSAAKWLLAIVVPAFAAGGIWYHLSDSLARKSDIEAHVKTDFAPLRAEVREIRAGVSTLIDANRRERQIKRLERELSRHQRQYEAKVADYQRRRAAGRWPKKPGMTSEHIYLESQLEELLEHPIVSPWEPRGD